MNYININFFNWGATQATSEETHLPEISKIEKITGFVLKNLAHFGIGLSLGMFDTVFLRIPTLIGLMASGSYEFKSHEFKDPDNAMNGLKLDFEDVVLTCLVAPIIEELIFRGALQSSTKFLTKHLYKGIGISDSKALTYSRVTAIALTATLFGVGHFTNASFSSYEALLAASPQVICATLGGITTGIAKEFFGSLIVPIGMHIMNNILASLCY